MELKYTPYKYFHHKRYDACLEWDIKILQGCRMSNNVITTLLTKHEIDFRSFVFPFLEPCDAWRPTKHEYLNLDVHHHWKAARQFRAVFEATFFSLKLNVVFLKNSLSDQVNKNAFRSMIPMFAVHGEELLLLDYNALFTFRIWHTSTLVAQNDYGLEYIYIQLPSLSNADVILRIVRREVPWHIT